MDPNFDDPVVHYLHELTASTKEMYVESSAAIPLELQEEIESSVLIDTLANFSDMLGWDLYNRSSIFTPKHPVSFRTFLQQHLIDLILVAEHVLCTSEPQMSICNETFHSGVEPPTTVFDEPTFKRAMADFLKGTP